MRRLASLFLALSLVAALPAPGQAQSMRELLDRLFVFGEGESQLFLVGSAGVPATEVHGDHFIPAETEANAVLLNFFENSVARNVSSFPIPTTVASETFEFVDGVPRATSSSFGPITAERAQTIGKGRLNAGFGYTRLRFDRLRGTSMDALELSFVHENVDFPNCDAIFGGDCSVWGTPQFENDVIELQLSLDIDADVFVFYTTYGVTDWLDLSVALPVVDMQMHGVSTATVLTTTGDEALHFFGGTPTDPDLTARQEVLGETSGIGDLAVRLKGRATQGEVWHLGVLGEVRAPTADDAEFLGTGDWNAKGLAILSGDLGGFSPHANLGFEYRGSDLDRNEFEVVAGFDQRMEDWVTLAVDVLAAFEVGDRVLTLPEPVELHGPFPRTISLSNIPDRDDDVIDGSFGLKFRTNAGLVIVANALVPLNDGGLRSSPVPTLAVEYSM